MATDSAVEVAAAVAPADLEEAGLMAAEPAVEWAGAECVPA